VQFFTPEIPALTGSNMYIHLKISLYFSYLFVNKTLVCTKEKLSLVLSRKQLTNTQNKQTKELSNNKNLQTKKAKPVPEVSKIRVLAISIPTSI